MKTSKKIILTLTFLFTTNILAIEIPSCFKDLGRANFVDGSFIVGLDVDSMSGNDVFQLVKSIKHDQFLKTVNLLNDNMLVIQANMSFKMSRDALINTILKKLESKLDAVDEFVDFIECNHTFRIDNPILIPGNSYDQFRKTV